MKRADWQIAFASLPPQLTLQQAARRLRHSYRLVASWARRLKYPAASGHLALWTAHRRREFSRVRWDKVPWHLSNADIGRRFCVSREIVRRRRKERNGV